MNNVAEALLARAHRASADAARFRRDPAGGPLAQVREADARALRAFARAAQELGQDGRGRPRPLG